MKSQRRLRGIRNSAQSNENLGNDMNVELNGLVIEPEVVEQGEIRGATEVAVDLLYRSGENSVSLMIEFEGMCKSLVEIVAEEGRVYVDLYRDWSQERPERIEICRRYYKGEEPGTSRVAPTPGEPLTS